MSIHIRAAISHNVRFQVMRKSLHSWSCLTVCCDNPFVHVKWYFTVCVSPYILLTEIFHFMLLYRRVTLYKCGTVIHVRTALNTKFNQNQFAVFGLIHAHRRTDCEYKSVRSYAKALKIQLIVSGSNIFFSQVSKNGGGGSENKNFASKCN